MTRTELIQTITDLLPWNQDQIIIPIETDTFLLYCLAIAGIGELLQLCYLNGMVFRKYYILIKIAYYKSKYSWVRSLMKPLGVCVYCQTPYINLVLWSLFFPMSQWFILSLGCVYVFLELIYLIKKSGKKLKNELK